MFIPRNEDGTFRFPEEPTVTATPYLEGLGIETGLTPELARLRAIKQMRDLASRQQASKETAGPTTQDTQLARQPKRGRVLPGTGGGYGVSKRRGG